jgi:hypothetical protein
MKVVMPSPASARDTHPLPGGEGASAVVFLPPLPFIPSEAEGLGEGVRDFCADGGEGCVVKAIAEINE